METPVSWMKVAVSASQVLQVTVEPAGYGSVVWPDSLSEWLVDRAGLQLMFCLVEPRSFSSRSQSVVLPSLRYPLLSA